MQNPCFVQGEAAGVRSRPAAPGGVNNNTDFDYRLGEAGAAVNQPSCLVDIAVLTLLVPRHRRTGGGARHTPHIVGLSQLVSWRAWFSVALGRSSDQRRVADGDDDRT